MVVSIHTSKYHSYGKIGFNVAGNLIELYIFFSFSKDKVPTEYTKCTIIIYLYFGPRLLLGRFIR